MTSRQSSLEKRLLQQLLAGEPDAMPSLRKLHQNAACRIARTVLRNGAAAEDVVQEAWRELLTAVEDYDPEKTAFRAWFLLSVYRLSLGRRRGLQAQRHDGTNSLDNSEVEAALERGTRKALSLDLAVAAAQMNKCLAMIPDRERMAVELLCHEGLTLEEASQRSGMPRKTLENCYCKGFLKLTEIISLVEIAG